MKKGILMIALILLIVVFALIGYLGVNHNLFRPSTEYTIEVKFIDGTIDTLTVESVVEPSLGVVRGVGVVEKPTGGIIATNVKTMMILEKKKIVYDERNKR